MKSQFEPTTIQHSDSPDAQRVTLRERIFEAVRRGEALVALCIAAATAWLAVESQPQMPVLWLFVLCALGVGCWAWLRRSARGFEVAGRGLVLLAASYLLHTDGGAPGGVAGVFFFWLAATALYYAFVLKPTLGSLIAVAAVAEFSFAALWSGTDTLSALAARGAFLLIVPMLLAMKLGAAARNPAVRLEDARTDSSTALYNRTGLIAHGKPLLAACRRDKRELTLAVFDCSDLLEAREVYGNRTSRKLIDRIVKKLGTLAGDQGLAARTGPTQFALALPMSRERAVHAIERVMGNPCRIELEGSGHNEIVLVPSVMVEAVPPAGSFERLFSALVRGLARLQEQESKRQRYLQRERERHSRPMATQPPPLDEPAPKRAPRLEADPVLTHQIPTIPMPLATR